MRLSILHVRIRYETDVVLARQRTRAIAERLGFLGSEPSRLATAVSEIARNAFQYARGGDVEFLVEDNKESQVFVVKITDQGPGIPDLDKILQGQYRSRTGMGLGISGARRLVDVFRIECPPGLGTTVVLGRALPSGGSPVTPETAAAIAVALLREVPGDPFTEIQQQNQELLRMMEELRRRKEQLEELNQEISDTNRGMVALYAELYEKTTHLREANELKARFLSNMSHEFRTPLSSILALSHLLLSRSDGGLTPEQEKQVSYMRGAAEDLAALVNDLLDLSKIEAGRITIRTTAFDVASLFSALRGMLKPLLSNPAVTLEFEVPEGIPPLMTDEGKVSQILRNLVSNSLKFTERGTVHVSARLSSDAQQVEFIVTDTGIGIAPEDQKRIFEEYSQVEGPLQRKVRGTGLGLPLSRRLAELLGGCLTVESQPGTGSTFRTVIPIVFLGVAETTDLDTSEDLTRYPVLVVEDDLEAQRWYEAFLRGTGFQCIQAHSIEEARKTLGRVQPLAIILDVLLPDGNGLELLTELKAEPATRDVPVIVATVCGEQRQALMLGAADFCTKPVDRGWILERLQKLVANAPISTVLIIDDEEVSRYLLASILANTKYTVLQAAGGFEGLRLARAHRPGLILLDLIMPDLSGFDVLIELRKDERTRDIPVIVVSNKALDEQELALLREKTAAFITKGVTSRDTMLAEIRAAMARIKQRQSPSEKSR